VAPDLKAVRCAQLLSRLEVLDELIKEQAKRTELVDDMGWDSAAFKKRSLLLLEARRCYVELLRLLLNDEHVDDGHTSLIWPDQLGEDRGKC
jgi:hypothetical protein